MFRHNLSSKVRDEYLRLKREHAVALAAIDRSPNPTDEQDSREQRAWDALIDFVEENNLQETSLDPRMH